MTAYQHEAPAMSSFSVDRHFSGILPFLTLDEKLSGADDVHLDPSNFTLPVPPVESPWPPSESSVTHPVYVHASRMLAARDAQTNGKSRNRVHLPLRRRCRSRSTSRRARRCSSTGAHRRRRDGRSAYPLALVSMLVNAQMPPSSRSPSPRTLRRADRAARARRRRRRRCRPSSSAATISRRRGRRVRSRRSKRSRSPSAPRRASSSPSRCPSGWWRSSASPPAPLLVEAARARPP